jgi:predicted  nucleic acid-binding Zn-ribbon protein
MDKILEEIRSLSTNMNVIKEGLNRVETDVTAMHKRLDRCENLFEQKVTKLENYVDNRFDALKKSHELVVRGIPAIWYTLL